MIRSARLLLIVAAGFAVLGAGLLANLMLSPGAEPTETARSTASIGGPFALIATDGKTVSDQTFRGKWMLIYFGYTSCPDACPTALNDMGVALDRLGAGAAVLQPIFITVDPKRDTREALAEYLKSFDPHIIALTGNADQIAAVAKKYKVYYAAEPGNGKDYIVNHSSYFYLINPQGKFVDVMAGDLSGDGIAARIDHFMKKAA
jgi:protein SCO1/2